MSIQVTINNSFYKKLDKAIEEMDEEAIKLGQDIVTYAVDISPVDTGAYVESHAVVARGGSGGGTRSRTSRNRPRAANPQEVKSAAVASLRASVASFIPSQTGGFTLINRAPHARYVEYGNGRGGRAYLVYESVRSKFG